MIEYNIADIVVLTDSYMKEWAPDERLIAAADGSRPQCDIGIIIGKNMHPRNSKLVMYEVFWFPANKIYKDHGRRLKLISAIEN